MINAFVVTVNIIVQSVTSFFGSVDGIMLDFLCISVIIFGSQDIQTLMYVGCRY